jgi:D-alanyl-D-alanine carboxypeptidase/D-alanyl-D-alanine-endopeptidase (penicillin-binding protein 4)
MYKMMKNWICLLAVSFVVTSSQGQAVSSKLSAAFAAFENDPQLQSGLASIYVIDAGSGTVVFEKNARIGLAPASTQKIITAATAYELLGKTFRYETVFGFTGSPQIAQLYCKPSGDPTLGSWRWSSTTETAVMKRLIAAIKKAGVTQITTTTLDAAGWESEAIPGGWIWDDIGNYYGAGAGALNWRENQYDLYMKSGKTVGDAVTVVGTKPRMYGYDIVSQVTAAAKGTGDNSYIYFPLTGSAGVVRGTIPVGEERFTISGAMPSPAKQFFGTLQDSLQKIGIAKTMDNVVVDKFSAQKIPANGTVFHTEQSPPLDSMVYWFLKRSINLYGEALAKTIALKAGKTASSEAGADVIRKFWKEKNIGVDATELNMKDGSGLSPQNRVTTHAQVSVLQYAQKQPWFAAYYLAFPEFNGMKLKSGTIGGAKSFCGYHTSKDGISYIVSFIVNNYNGPSSSLVQKMYRVLDVLK